MAMDLPFLLTVSCPALSAPPDGRKFGSKYFVDHEVHFTCNPGFRLIGPSSLACLPNGTWTGEQPRCRGRVPPSLGPARWEGSFCGILSAGFPTVPSSTSTPGLGWTPSM